METIRAILTEKLLNSSTLITETGCQIWLQGCTVDGYGILTHKRIKYLAHRLSYKLFKHDVPNTKLVLHHCDIRCCINPEHLYMGTDADNSRDMIARSRDRHQKGSLNGNAKLNEAQVREIRLRLEGTDSYFRIGKDFEVKPHVIEQIHKGTSWGWLDV